MNCQTNSEIAELPSMLRQAQHELLWYIAWSIRGERADEEKGGRGKDSEEKK